jgi:hypothetical protein
MLKRLLFLPVFLGILFFPFPVFASANNSFVEVVNPVRGSDFWDMQNQRVEDAVNGELSVLQNQNVKATFLIRYDALQNPNIINSLKPTIHEKGLFLEVTPTLTTASGVQYHQSQSWHNAASVLLTGYSLDDRKKLIDKDFEEFKNIFGYYPKSVGAWWIDAGSLSYMEQKYQITNAMIVADQYSTDSYQIWGQYWGVPYYPAKNNALFPAQTADNKIPLVMTQWANRDPVNGYGTGVEESTYSVQANDYIDYHNLDTAYFSRLVDTYTKPESTGNQFGEIIVGLENSYSWDKYKSEYQNQISELVKKQNSGQIKLVPLSDFANWYKQKFPELSPDHLIVSKDITGSQKQAVWYMNNFYRAGFISDNKGAVIRDLRQYVTGQSEICLEKVCSEVNFATFATRVLDSVTYRQQKVLDLGQIDNLKVERSGGNVNLSYENAASKTQTVEFLPRDISINGKSSSIDTFILDTINQGKNVSKQSMFNNNVKLISPLFNQLGEFLVFWLFIVVAVLIPGEVIIKKVMPHQGKVIMLFLSTVLGLVELTLIGFFSQLILENYYLVPVWVLLNIGLYLYFKLYRSYSKPKFASKHYLLGGLIILGTIFICIPTFRSGLEYGYGVGFWGPNSHDGVWHLALINQLLNQSPPQNPILSGKLLQNYHYLYDLLVAVVSQFTGVFPVDLLFREFPLLFGLLLGVGTLSILNLLLERRNFLVSGISLYLVYTAGSFGWIVEMLKHQGWNGESDFWANQAISFNLNPPFMISLLIVVAVIELLVLFQKHQQKLLLLPIIILTGSLLEFKAYAAILMGLTLLVLVIIKAFKKDYSLISVLIGMGVFTLVLLVPNYPSISAIFQTGSGVFEFAPFWFIHSMIDSPDRLGITRLALTRMSGYENENILKIIYAEGLGVLLFIFGNLGVRLLGFAAFFNRRLWSHFGFLIIFIFSIFSILIPLLFIQKGTPWNTIQFFYYFLFFGSLLSAIVLAGIYRRLPKPIFGILLLILITVAPINCIAVAQGYLFPKPHAFISTNELDGLKFLASQPDGVVLTYPFDKNLKSKFEEPLPLIAYDTTAYVSAFSKKAVFEEDEIQQPILDLSPTPEYVKRITLSNDFFSGQEKTQAVAFLASNHIKYIYLPKVYGVTLNDAELGIENVFENDEIIIYEVKK